VGVGWEAWKAGGDPGSEVPGLPEEIHHTEEYRAVPVEDAFWDG